MEENFFWRKVDKRSRKDLVEYLQKHERYYVYNSWNVTKTFANNVKLHRMNLSVDADLAYKLIESFIWSVQVTKRLREFRAEYPTLNIFFNGRSSGYACLLNENRSDNFNTYPEEYEDKYYWDMEELRELTDIVQAFDRICDILRGDLIYYCKNPELIDS